MRHFRVVFIFHYLDFMRKIIVPSDFTPVSAVAIKYGCELANATDSVVHLLHIVKSKGEEIAAKAKLDAQAHEFSISSGRPVHALVHVGNIFDDIPHVADKENAEMIVMGTHGLQGMQFIVGSNALRIITESKVPMIIIQAATTRSANVSKLLVPLDLHRDTKQKLKIASEVALRFKSEVHLISPKETDEYLHNQLARNTSYAEGFLEEKGISYKTVVTDASSGSFVKELLKYARYAEIDLICVLNSAEERLVHAFGMDSEQKIITNEAAIPVMIMNTAALYRDASSVLAQ